MSSNATKIDKPPMLPPKKIAPDPDYEIIEFSNEQYSNAQPIRSSNGALKCELCGSMSAKLKCDQCNQQLFCAPCDDMFHRHPKRNTHMRKAIVIQSDVKPPLPPKGEGLLPVPPPRRKKTGMTPMLPRKEMPFMQRPKAPPSPALSLRERVSSIKRLIVPSSKNNSESSQKHEVQPPRSETPNSDSSAKLPSLAMERIKIQTNNARDRMEIMQKRYHEYQEQVKSASSVNINRTAMDESPTERVNNDNRNSSNRSDPFGGRLRSGSLSNFSNHLSKFGNDTRFNPNQNDFDETTTQDDGSLSDTRSRAFSSSVHDLSFGRNTLNNNQWPFAQQQFAAPFGYNPNQYHNHHMQPNGCMNCSQQQLWNPQMMDPQWNPKNLNGSNMSLNLPPGGYYPPQFNGTTWMNNASYRKPDPYPYQFGMMPYNNAYPQPMSRPHSRVQSRAASPALSTKSRKSTMSSRNLTYRNSYVERELTDDESSDSMGYVDDLHRAKLERYNSMKASPQRNYDEDNEVFSRRNSYRHNSRTRRASSSARSISSRPERRPSQGIRSDSTQDSETELGTRALVQAKIREKVAQASSIDGSSSDLTKTKATAPVKNNKKPAPTTKVNKSELSKVKSLPKQPTKHDSERNEKKISSSVQTEKPKQKEPSPIKTTTENKKDSSPSSGTLDETELNKIADSAPSGPVPTTPDYEWECEFCTFTNEANIKICAICCKTPSTRAVRKQEEETKTPIDGKAIEQADISKEGFWIVSTSEEDLSEIQSYESNQQDVEAEAERSDNDIEVMTILSQTAVSINGFGSNEEPPPVEKSDPKDSENLHPPIDFASQNDDSETNINEIVEKTQNDEKNNSCEIIGMKDIRTQVENTVTIDNTPITRVQESNPTISSNENQKPSLDAELLAYIDQSLKTLIGAGSNIPNQNVTTTFPYFPPSLYMNNNQIPPMQMPPLQIPPITMNPSIPRTSNDAELYKVLLGANSYSYDEIQVALANRPDADPITWLNDNWQKLIETVQTLATKYGQEHKENIVGTISSIEAREALKKHKGNVWHAVTECIESRQIAFNTIKSKGNFSSEDIVTYLTAHNGNLEKALEELNRVQMKPFLLKILNSPAEPVTGPPKTEEIPTNISNLAEENVIDSSEVLSIEPQENVDQAKNEEKNILRDLEAIIGSMEEKQSKQTEALLQTIESLVGNLNTTHVSRPMSSASSFSVASLDRIDMKSPIVLNSKVANNTESSSDVETDVKDFVSRHIQDIVPDVAALVNKELVDDTNNAEKLNFTVQSLENEVANDSNHVESVNNQTSSTEAPNTSEVVAAASNGNELPATATAMVEQIADGNEIEILEPEVLENGTIVENIQAKPVRTSSMNRMKFTVNSSLYPRASRSQMERMRIRKLEKQLLHHKRRQSAVYQERRNSEYLSDSTITPDGGDELQHGIENGNGNGNDNMDNSVSVEKTFSLSIVEQAIVDNNKEMNRTDIESGLVQVSQSINNDQLNEKDPKSRNLSELVEDTKNLIQQMKFEINEDIAMSASEFEFDDDDDDGDMYLDEESINSEYSDSDSWEDIDNDSEISDQAFSEEGSDNEMLLEEIEEEYDTENADEHDEEQFGRSSQSVESEYFSEARETVSREDLQNDRSESVIEVVNLDQNEVEEVAIMNGEVEVENKAAGQTVARNLNSNEIKNESEMNNNEIVFEVETSGIDEMPSSTETTGVNVADSTHDITDHMIEIQQSLHSSTIVTLNFRDQPNREKSSSVEPSAFSPTPVEIDHSLPKIPDDIPTIDSEIISREIPTEAVPEHIDENEAGEENIQNSIAENEVDLNNADSANNNEQTKSDTRTPSQDISEELVESTNDTGSEIDEISVDISHASVSTTDDSLTKDNVSTHSASSVAASEKLVESYKYKKITVPVVSECSQSQSSINVMQLKKTDPNKSSTIPKNKIPVRRPSFGEPSPSIRNIQNELMNKQLRTPTKISKKPSKIVPPKLFFKTGFASQDDKAQPSTSGVKSEKIDHNMPSTSSGKQTIPKKKYFETCFSDDYQTSDDESRPVSSRKVIPNLVQIMETYTEESFDIEIVAERLLHDEKIQTRSEALLAAELIQKKFREDKALWAATQCSTIDQAINLLQQECELCMEIYPMNQIVSMLKCTHSCCEDCAKNYFTIQITDRSITDCTCPFCKLPDLNATESTEDDALEYFSNMDILLKSILDETVHELFQRKLRDRTLMQDPNFKWCVQCSSGFFARPRQKKLICPDCGSITCTQCRKPWEAQHEGITCEQFADWLELNDPDKQAQGVAQHLQLHGISCPKCKFKYSLARGGCMHFTCTQCKYEFCYGCNKPFKMGAKCKVSDYCAKLGLHSHHPRNCLFYLRDKEPLDLQTLLKMHNVPFNTDPLDFGVQPNSDDDGITRKLCPMPIQKETPTGLIDTVCKGDIEENSAGLCRTHFVEYLVSIVAKANVDPLPILDLTDCVQELRRSGIALPERGPWDTDPIYRDMCSKIVEKHIPLD